MAAAATSSDKLESYCGEGNNYSVKLFLFGLPLDVTKNDIISNLKQFGFVKMVWPKWNYKAKERLGRNYLIIALQDELSVHRLIQDCVPEGKKFFYNFSYQPKNNCGEVSIMVKVTPWKISDNYYRKEVRKDENESFKIFVGGVHPTLSARELVSKIQFVDAISECRILADSQNYPKGAAIMTFSNIEAYKSALKLRFIKINYCDNYEKYLEFKLYTVKQCETCGTRSGPPFNCTNRKCPAGANCRKVNCYDRK